MRRTDRLFELIQIFRDGRLHRAEDLAEVLGVSQRTVYRDIESLVGSGIAIEGARGVGYLLREPVHLPPLSFTEEELRALHLGAQMVSAYADAAHDRAAKAALSKIDAVLPSDRPRSGHSWGFWVSGAQGEREARSALAPLSEAIRTRNKVSINYISLKEETSARTVRPLQIECWGHVWTFTAWCELREDFRMFRIDRLASYVVLEERFRDEPGRSLTDLLARMCPKEDITHYRPSHGPVGLPSLTAKRN